MSDSETKTARGPPSSLSPRPCPGPFALTPARQARSRSSIPGPSAPAPRLPDCCQLTSQNVLKKKVVTLTARLLGLTSSKWQ